MKTLIYILVVVTALIFNSCQTTNSIYIVRHAEKSTEPGNNPHLTTEGKVRAEHLKELLKDKSINAIFSTKTSRTIETVAPLSLITKLPVKYYSNDTSAQFLNMATSLQKNILIAAHSNTIVPMLKQLKLPFTINSITDDDYDNLFIIKVKNGKPVKIVETTYGAPSPFK